MGSEPDDDLEDRVERLEEQVSKTMPSRRQLLAGAGTLGVGALLGGGAGSAAAADGTQDTSDGTVRGNGGGVDIRLDELRDPGGDEVFDIDDTGAINAAVSGREFRFDSVSADRSYVNGFDESQTSRDPVIGYAATDSNAGILGLTKSRVVGGEGQYAKIGALDPSYQPLGWWAWDAANHELSLYTTTDPKGNITSAPEKRLDVEFGSDNEQVRWSNTSTFNILGSGSTVSALIRAQSQSTDAGLEFWDENGPRWNFALDRSRGDSFRLFNENTGKFVYEIDPSNEETNYQGNVVKRLAWDSGTTVNRPSSPNTGERYFDTDIGKPIWYNGSNWVDAQGNIV
jgi:hypothetical protein